MIKITLEFSKEEVQQLFNDLNGQMSDQQTPVLLKQLRPKHVKQLKEHFQYCADSLRETMIDDVHEALQCDWIFANDLKEVDTE